jgi:hypothetical protein
LKRRRDTKFTRRQADTLRGQYVPSWTLSTYAPDVTAARREHLCGLPIGTQIKMDRAVSKALTAPAMGQRRSR